MTNISNVLYNKASNCALIPFITAGYPDLQSTIKALHILDYNGADIIELGIPYSDALADGPLIQEASRIALTNGVYIDQVLSILNAVSSKLNAPIIIFTYYNPILVRGVYKFITDIASSGAKGLIIPDLPLEETDYITQLCLNFHVELILFISPTSSNLRVNAVLSKSSGCIYLVSSNGVTGLRSQINSHMGNLAGQIKLKTNKLVILGFGISNINQVSNISKWSIDGIVIGSAFIKAMSNRLVDDAILALGDLCADMRYAIDHKI